MNKVFSALRKARDDKQWAAELHDEILDLLPQKPVLPAGRSPASSSPQRLRWTWQKHKVTVRSETLDEHLVALHQPTALATEQYRKLYTEIVRAGRTRTLRTLLVSSALGGEGKTTSALNLAITMGTSGDTHGVLLVDADLRKPSMHRYLGTKPTCGLAEYVRGEVEYTQLFVKTAIPGLTVVYAGNDLEQPFALLSSEKMRLFFEQIQSQMCYRYILVDSSPVLLTSEPRTLVPYTDSTLLVVRAGKTPKDMLLQAIEAIGAENILGLVFNGVSEGDLGTYGHYYKSGYGHANGRHSN